MRRPKGLPHGGGKTQASSPLPHDAGDSRRWVRRLEGTHVDWRPAEAVWRRTNHKEPSHRRNPEVGLRRSRERKEKIPVASGVWRRDCSSRWLVAASRSSPLPVVSLNGPGGGSRQSRSKSPSRCKVTHNGFAPLCLFFSQVGGLCENIKVSSNISSLSPKAQKELQL